MDTEIRELETRAKAEPGNEEIKQALVRAWDRAGHTPSDMAGLVMQQEDWHLRREKLYEELREKNAGERFKLFLAELFKEYPALDQFLFEAYVPRFADGDPIHAESSILVNPKWWCYHGILSFEEVYENTDGYDFLEKEKRDLLVYKPGIFNSGLSNDECEHITKMISFFREIIKQRFGTNCRVLFKRDPDSRKWYPEGVSWNREDYDCGY